MAYLDVFAADDDVLSYDIIDQTEFLIRIFQNVTAGLLVYVDVDVFLTVTLIAGIVVIETTHLG